MSYIHLCKDLVNLWLSSLVFGLICKRILFEALSIWVMYILVLSKAKKFTQIKSCLYQLIKYYQQHHLSTYFANFLPISELKHQNWEDKEREWQYADWTTGHSNLWHSFPSFMWKLIFVRNQLITLV